MSKKINVLSLFDGISIAQQALKNLGIKVDFYFASEIDKYAIQITQKNFPNTIQVGDVKNIRVGSELSPARMAGKTWWQNIDLLIGGSPCQDLSIAKKGREGLSGSRSGLFWEYVRILKEVKPKYFVLENVASMPKEAKDVITEALGVEPIMINAALVSAQNRKRLFWTNVPNVIQPEDRGILLWDILEPKVDDSFIVKPKSNTIRSSGMASGIDDRHNWDTIRIGQIGKGGQGDRIYSPDGKSVNLSANGGGRGAKTGLYAVALTETRTDEAKKIRREYRQKTGRDFSPRREKELKPRGDEKANTITTGQTKESLIAIEQRPRGKNKGSIHTEKSPTLTSNSFEHNNKLLGNSIIRKLTPVECERLQSLPDNYTEGISNTQRYKALGNGFNCAVIEHILKNIK